MVWEFGLRAYEAEIGVYAPSCAVRVWCSLHAIGVSYSAFRDQGLLGFKPLKFTPKP